MTTQEQQEKKRARIIFWSRFSAYVLFGLVAPLMFLGFRFHLFTAVSGVKVSLSGWGIVGIIFASVFFLRVAKQVKKGLPYSFFTQVLEGIIKVIIPLVTVALCLHVAQNYIKQIVEFLVCLTICEMIAIPANPFPAWIHSSSENAEINKYKKIYMAVTGNYSNDKKD